MAIESNIPAVDVLPPMTPGVRDFMYGVLAWAAGLLTISTSVLAVTPELGFLDRPLGIANIIVLGLWTLGGFKAKGAVSDVVA